MKHAISVRQLADPSHVPSYLPHKGSKLMIIVIIFNVKILCFITWFL